MQKGSKFILNARVTHLQGLSIDNAQYNKDDAATLSSIWLQEVMYWADWRLEAILIFLILANILKLVFLAKMLFLEFYINPHATNNTLGNEMANSKDSTYAMPTLIRWLSIKLRLIEVS